MKLLRFLLFPVLFCCLTAAGRAQSSFVYLQGDKQTPFYVKLEGEMLPRYGKNYCIIPQLAAGPINLEILFQQNVYPPQKFVVQVPEHGQRGFLITKTADGFALYDLQQRFYLPAGNKPEDDHLPAAPEEAAPVASVPDDAPASKDTTVETEHPAAVPETTVVKNNKPRAAKPRKENSRPVAPPAAAPVAHDDGPVFIDNMELNSTHNVQAAAAEKKEAPAPEEAPAAVPEPERTQEQQPAAAKAEPGTTEESTATEDMHNSDCPSAVEDERFENIYKSSLKTETEEERLQYLEGALSECYNTRQAGILAKSLDSDAARFVFLKKAYSRITDQAAFRTLLNLFNSEEYKNAFKELTHQ